MTRELTKIPTDTLIDMLFVILASGLALTAGDRTEIEKIQEELLRRGEEKHQLSRALVVGYAGQGIFHT